MSNEKAKGLMTLLKETRSTDIVELEEVKERFIQLHNQIHGGSKGELIYHKEVFNFKKLLAETPDLRECSQLSLYGAFLDLNVNGLSLEKGSQPDCYIQSRNFNVSKKGEPDKWEKRAELKISPYGELKIRMRSGQIKYADDPVIVYDCDRVKIGLNDKGKKVVKDYEKTLPRPREARIILCFVRIERHDGSFEMPFLDMNDVERLKRYSGKQNKNSSANALYTSGDGGQIDEGFLKAKTIKHAFKSYPKVRIGAFSSTDEEAPTEVDYGFDPNDHTIDTDHEEISDTGSVKPKDDFASALEEDEDERPKTITIDQDDDEDITF